MDKFHLWIPLDQLSFGTEHLAPGTALKLSSSGMLDLGYCTLVKSYFSNLKYGNFVASILLYKLGVLENGAEWNLSVLVFESSKKFL